MKSDFNFITDLQIKFHVNYWNKEHGTLFAIIGDFKNQNDSNCNQLGHLYSDGTQCCVVEFIVDSSKINNIKNVFPELKNNPVVTIQRTGRNFFAHNLG